MNNNNFSRRQFLQSAFYSSLIYGSGALPSIVSSSSAMPSSIRKEVLVNLNLSGGPDFRHLLVPAYDPADDSFGGKYWKHRAAAHKLVETGVSAQQRYEQDYIEFTVGDSSWISKGLVDVTGANSGVKFGILKEAGWLVDMVKEGNVALVFNAVGGTNRAHDLSSIMLSQGNVLATINDGGGSGWGGRLARSAGSKSISLTSSPSAFCFGPLGAAPNYDPARIDNVDLRSIENSRNIGLFDFDINSDQLNNADDKMARAAKNYYAAIRQEQLDLAYHKARDHERTIREFGSLLAGYLNDTDIPVPFNIRALDSSLSGVNVDPNRTDNPDNDGRRTIRSGKFAQQIRNLYDMLAVNDLAELNPRVMSMGYGGWDTHGGQRQVPSVLASDPNNPYEDRGIESNFRDIFSGKFGNSPTDPSALHGGFSALWDSLSDPIDRQHIAITMAGEFGRQIRDNDDAGTDHGKGNLMLVIGENVRGGVYGEIFQDNEVDKYDDPNLKRPDIDPLTDIDPIFSKVCDWIAPDSGTAVFPRTDENYSGDTPRIEQDQMFDNMMIPIS